MIIIRGRPWLVWSTRILYSGNTKDLILIELLHLQPQLSVQKSKHITQSIQFIIQRACIKHLIWKVEKKNGRISRYFTRTRKRI